MLKSGMSLLIAITLFSQILVAAEVKPKEPAPDFSVTNAKGETVKLSDWKGKKNLVVVFSRANWCPYCMGQLSEISKSYPKIQKLDAEVLVIFREEREGAAGLAKSQKKTGAKFPLLLDLGKKNTSDYSTTGFTTYIISKDGMVKDILAGKKSSRPKVAEILKSLEK